MRNWEKGFSMLAAVCIMMGSTSSMWTKVNAEEIKDEMVFVQVDEEGNASNVIVSDQLKNISGDVRDSSVLEDIENTKGKETFDQDGSTLIWHSDGSDITYQGKTDKKLPVKTTVRYYLDNQEVSESEITGKSGHLRITYSYENTSEEDTGTFVPFVMATGLLFDENRCSDITTENARVISDGDRVIIFGIGFPGVQERLGTDIVSLPESFTVEADVKDYQSSEAITFASNSVFSDLETEDLSGLTDDLDTLSASGDQLKEGASALKDGMDQLMANSGTLVSGIDMLYEGGTQVSGGSASLNEGIRKVNDGMSQAASQVSDQLLPGINALNDGVSQMTGRLFAEDGIPALQNGLKQLSDAGAALAQGAEDMQSGTGQFVEKAGEIQTAVGTIDANASAVASGMDSLSSGVGQISQNAQALARSAQNLPSSSTVTVDHTEEINALNGVLAAMDENDPNYAVIENVIAQLSQETVTVTNPDLDAAAQGLQQIAGACDQLSASAVQLSDGTHALAEGISQLDSQLCDETSGLTAASNALNSGAGQMHQGITQMNDGIGALSASVSGMENEISAGLNELQKGTGALADGGAALSTGLDTLKDGTASLKEGGDELTAGASALADGIGSLKEGTGTLTDGVRKLDEGAAQLSSGMTRFDEEGIDVLANTVNDEFGTLFSSLQDMLSASRTYTNFAGIDENMKGEVSFIFTKN